MTKLSYKTQELHTPGNFQNIFNIVHSQFSASIGKRFLFLLLCIFFLPGKNSINAQLSEVNGGPMIENRPGECLTDIQRQVIQVRLQENINLLRHDGKLPLAHSRSGLVLFEFPMQWNNGFSDYGFYGISNYVDHNTGFPGLIQDYACGQRSYDTNDGYNHRGTDFFLWPFAWNLVEQDAVKIVAAAPGVIIGKTDGNDYHSCAFSTADWNAVYLMHDDGSTTWYGHMKKNSLTSKNIGETVTAGEYLGIVGSSGNSTGPHLHFELYGSGGELLDPYAGDCNLWNTDSWWVEQRPYIDPAINKIQTHFAPPDMLPCPEEDDINASDEFQAGDLVYLVGYFKDQRSTDQCRFSIVQPNEVIALNWIFFQPEPYYSASYWYWTFLLPTDAVEGTWTFQCVFAGKTYRHHFNVTNGSSALNDDGPFFKDLFIYPDQHELWLKANCTSPFDGKIFISGSTGVKLFESTLHFDSGENDIKIPWRKYGPGLYFVTILSGDNSMITTRKIVFD
ncbi:MAG TPA: M23 family metallopeptidase [Saprospiraceae bacterium]|nr:M23 family metallopeptidase [Saprospiraceae bacterium]